MLSALLDRLAGVFNRRFLIACWLPPFFALLLCLLPPVLVWGWAEAWRRWTQIAPDKPNSGLGPPALWLVVGMLLLVTLAAYLLNLLARPIAHLYEGYAWPRFLRRWRTKQVRREWEKLRRERAEAALARAMGRYASVQERLHYEYPPEADLLLPTRLGNIVRAAEAYPGRTYGMDAPFWWPRLWPLLPQEQRDALEDALTTMMAALNLGLLLPAVTVYATVYVARSPIPLAWAWACAVLLAGGFFSWLCVQGASVQARAYGQQIRVAVDLHRFALFAALRFPVPATPVEERVLWEKLSSWLYNTDLGVAQGLAYQPHEPAQEAARSSREVTD